MPSYKQEEPKKAGTFFVTPGIYKVEVEKAVEKSSQAGNPMIKLECRVLLGDDGVGPILWDHLVFTPKASWKIDQFRASIGQAVVPGESVEIEAEDLVGKIGIAEVGEEDGTSNPDQKFNLIVRWVFGDERKEYMSGKKRTKDEDIIPF
jgi:hypothetical protein